MLPSDKEWLQEHVIAKIGTPATVKLVRTTMGGSVTVELEASNVDVKDLGEQAMVLLVEMECDTCRDERRDIQ